MKQPMSRAAVDGIELDYQRLGDGEPVVLVHPGIFSDWFTLLTHALAGRFLVVSYHRAGCAGSSHVPGPVSIAQEAHHCRSLMRHIGIDRAHLVGHSNSGNLVLQLALDAPEVVHSLVVAEPALMTVPSANTARTFVRTAMQQYAAGDKATAIDTFLRGTFGERSMNQSPIWNERQELLLGWLPDAEPFVLPGASHLLQIENPRGMAEGMAAFYARHTLSPAR
jgi:pimeloyl-ACP methyl ester carboxylesterase